MRAEGQHGHSLRAAEAGIYELSRFSRFSENYLAAGGTSSLSDYTTAYGSGVLDGSLRQSIVFSDHSLATDSVFELVSCRNVLIYFEKQLQEHALGILQRDVNARAALHHGRARR